MITIENKLVSELHLLKIDLEKPCYSLAQKKYLLFWDSLITKTNMEEILKWIDSHQFNDDEKEWKTIVVMAKTAEGFSEKDLMFFNGVNTIVIFYLINDETGESYVYTRWIPFIGMNPKKQIKAIQACL